MAQGGGPARRGAPNRLRIVGGAWRGRKLSFPDSAGLRPTPDRVRETVFNWLQPVIEGARCLDLFAGSGALGLEALSRGAALAVLVDRDPRVIAALGEHLRVLGAASRAELHCTDALAFLRGPARRFDVVFLDPPFRQQLLGPACMLLEQGGWLAPGARIYLEAEREQGTPEVPDTWRVVRSKTTGQVGYHLALRD